jgi:hypothetical protein
MRMLLTVLTVLAAAGLLAGPALAKPGVVTVGGGETVTVPGTDTQLTFAAVRDGRCPVDVDCMWEGLVEVELLVRTGSGDWVRTTLCNMCDQGWHEALVRGWIVGLVRLEPSVEDLAALGRVATVEDYRVLLTVEARP